MELTMQHAVVQGAIGALVQAADTNDMRAFRIEIQKADGRVDTYLSDNCMARSHMDPAPMSIEQAVRLIEAAGLRVMDAQSLELVG